MGTPPARPILFTAFEPSGDDLAAATIAAMRKRDPSLQVYAWGGAGMQAAGATLVAKTGEDAVVGIPGPGKILEHLRINRDIAAWMDEHKPAMHIAVDSPAANFPICKLAKQRGIPVAHLAAPQLWAWASWRVRKLRNRTDHVLCLLPFEEAWFRKRDVPASFIGHPLFDADIKTDPALPALPSKWWEDTDRPLRLAVLPGSRPKELRRHLPLLLQVHRLVRDAVDRPIETVFALNNAESAASVESIAAEWGGLPEGTRLTTTGGGPAAQWADACLTKSGTVTLHIARQRTPMVVLYRTPKVLYRLLGQWLISTPDRAMPNLIAGKRVIPEFIPHFGDPTPIADELLALLTDKKAACSQQEALGDIASCFEGRRSADTAAERLCALLSSVRE